MTPTSMTLPSATYDVHGWGILKEAWHRTYDAKGIMWASMIIYLIASIAILMLGYVVLSYWFLGTFSSEIMRYSVDTDLYKSGLEWVRWLILFPMHPGILLLGVRHCANLPVHIKQVFSPYKLYLPLLIIGLILFIAISVSKASIIYIQDQLPDYLLLAIGFTIADIFLTLFFSIWLTFAALLVIEKKESLFSALKISIQSFKQHWIKIILIILFVVVPYLIIANVLLFTPTFMVLGATNLFWFIWGTLVVLLLLSSIWVIPMFLNIAGILYRTMLGVNHG